MPAFGLGEGTTNRSATLQEFVADFRLTNQLNLRVNQGLDTEGSANTQLGARGPFHQLNSSICLVIPSIADKLAAGPDVNARLCKGVCSNWS